MRTQDKRSEDGWGIVPSVWRSFRGLDSPSFLSPRFCFCFVFPGCVCQCVAVACVAIEEKTGKRDPIPRESRWMEAWSLEGLLARVQGTAASGLPITRTPLFDLFCCV